MTALQRLGLLLLLMVQSACTPKPVLETKIDWIPSQTTAGRACIQACQQQRESCQGNCQARYQQCFVDTGEQAQEQLPSALARYQLALDNYWLSQRLHESAKRDYERRLFRLRQLRQHASEQCQANAESSSCNDLRDYNHEIARSSAPSPQVPQQPEVPDLERMQTQLAQRQCDRECGCQQRYSACFLGCGGRIIETPVCVQNCD